MDEDLRKALAMSMNPEHTEVVGPARTCFIFCPNFRCLIPQIQPIMLRLCPIMPSYSGWPCEVASLDRERAEIEQAIAMSLAFEAGAYTRSPYGST
jgi:hypothetical protein